MKILLINPSRNYHKKSKGVRLGLPLGLMYIASVLEKEAYDVALFDCLISDGTRIKDLPDDVHHGVDDDYFKTIIQKEAPDIVGLSSPFTAQLDNLTHAAKLVKEVNTHIHIVAGGPHFAVTDKEYLLQNSNIDSFVIGEGEIPMLQLVRAIQEGKSFDHIHGLAYKETNQSGQLETKSTSPERLRPLDDLPFPAYHLIDMDLFFSFQSQGLSARLDTQKRTISMITSRGCPFDCVFCSVHLHMGKKVRAHSAEYVLSHIQHVVDRYDVEYIFFEDDNLTYWAERSQKIFQGIIDNEINLLWSTPNGVRADKLNKALLKTMKEAGCAGLIVGCESGDQEVLDTIVSKNLDLEIVEQVAAWCQELSIQLTAFFVIGFPGETKKNIQNTIDFACKLYENYEVVPLLNIATPLIGSRLYDIVLRKGYLAKEVNPHSLSAATQPIIGDGMIQTPEFSPEDLKDFARQLENRMQQIDKDFAGVAYHV